MIIFDESLADFSRAERALDDLGKAMTFLFLVSGVLLTATRLWDIHRSGKTAPLRRRIVQLRTGLTLIACGFVFLGTLWTEGASHVTVTDDEVRVYYRASVRDYSVPRADIAAVKYHKGRGHRGWAEYVLIRLADGQEKYIHPLADGADTTQRMKRLARAVQPVPQTG